MLFRSDTRENNEYTYVLMGNVYWMAENLRWSGSDASPVGAGYAGSDVMGKTLYERLYTWNDATGGVTASGLGAGPKGICPEGWSIPTNEDWVDFAAFLNDGQEIEFVSNWKKLGEKVMAYNAKFNDNEVWPFSGNTWPSDKYLWNAMPAGNCINDYSNFDGLNSYAFWWSSTEKDSQNANYR